MTPSYSFELLTVLNSARSQEGWSVLLVPSKKYDETLVTISALCDMQISGRTILWPDTGNKLSIVPAGQEFSGSDQYTLFVAGWTKTEDSDSVSLSKWRADARKIASTNSHA